MEIKNKLLVVVGPSGVGKDTVMSKVFQKNPSKFIKAVTHTSRQMRKGEQEGVNYHYVSKEKFLQLKEEDNLIESNFYNNNYYGLSKMEVEKAEKMNDKIMYAIIDIHGANSVNAKNIPANYVAILPKNEQVLVDRLKGRGTESEEVMKGRLQTAKEELEQIAKSNLFNIKIVNDNLDVAVGELYGKLKELYPFLNNNDL